MTDLDKAIARLQHLMASKGQSSGGAGLFCKDMQAVFDELDRLRLHVAEQDMRLALLRGALAKTPKPPAPVEDWKADIRRGQECPGHERGGTGPACCDRAGEYNGFGSDGPRLFTCPKGCSCHD